MSSPTFGLEKNPRKQLIANEPPRHHLLHFRYHRWSRKGMTKVVVKYELPLLIVNGWWTKTIAAHAPILWSSHQKCLPLNPVIVTDQVVLVLLEVAILREAVVGVTAFIAQSALVASAGMMSLGWRWLSSTPTLEWVLPNALEFLSSIQRSTVLRRCPVTSAGTEEANMLKNQEIGLREDWVMWSSLVGENLQMSTSFYLISLKIPPSNNRSRLQFLYYFCDLAIDH